MRDELTRGTRVRVALDSRERPMHCHHEKVAVIDGEVAFVGGIDLTTYAGDRLDSSEHPARGSIGWHDAAASIRGPAVADVAAHFSLRWAEVTGEVLPTVPPPSPAGPVELQVVRTVPERIYDRLPVGEFGILESYLRGLRAARRLIYLENQFLWSPEIVSVLVEKLRRPLPRLHPVPVGRRAQARLHPREDRDRRRRLADPRLGEPERALPLQRHGDEHRRA